MKWRMMIMKWRMMKMMKNLVMLLFVALAILMLGRIFKLIKENSSKQEAFIYQKGDGFDLKKTKVWIVYPRVAVVNDFFDYNSVTSDCSFTINDGSDKEKFACLRIFDEETGIAIFLASEKMEITKDENIPQWAKNSTAVIIDYLIDKEILEKILGQEELIWEKEMEESGESELNSDDIMQNRYPLIRNIQSENREFISRFFLYFL